MLRVGAAVLCAVLAEVWWLGGNRPADIVASAPQAVAPDAASAPLPGAVGELSAWGTSPFGDGPAVLGPDGPPDDSEPSPFRAQVQRFESLRSQIESLPDPSAELLQVARGLWADLPRQMASGELNPTEGLLLSGALLELLEPDAQLRAAELAQFGAQYLPAAGDESSS
jgi:hypothetical protein